MRTIKPFIRVFFALLGLPALAITGGKEVSPDVRPEVWFYNGMTGKCTATFVSPRVLFTAAHCVDDMGLPFVSLARKDEDPFAEDFGQNSIHTLAKVFVHPDYNKELKTSDFGIIVLPPEKAQTQWVAEISQDLVRQDSTRSFYQIGFGESDTDFGSKKRMGRFNYIGNDDSLPGGYSKFAKQFFEQGSLVAFIRGEPNFENSCSYGNHGDSGGPIFDSRTNELVAVYNAGGVVDGIAISVSVRVQAPKIQRYILKSVANGDVPLPTTCCRFSNRNYVTHFPLIGEEGPGASRTCREQYQLRHAENLGDFDRFSVVPLKSCIDRPSVHWRPTVPASAGPS